MVNRQMVSVNLDGEDVQSKREELRRYFHQSVDLFESLFELLRSDEAFYRQSEPTRHPMIFYFGHTAVFYINKLIAAGVLQERINPRFESLFAVGVDEMRWDEESGRFSWPEVDAVREYRKCVRECVDGVISVLPMALPITRQDPFWAILMGIEHERIHIETSSVLHRQMPLRFIRSHADFPVFHTAGEVPENALVPISGSVITLGKGECDGGLYGWDNEYGLATYEVSPFEASKYLVSNGEYLEFVHAGGYKDERWWDEEGEKYLLLRQALCPPFWVMQGDGTYHYRALAQEMPLPLNWPVEVNALEAQAFCRWKSAQKKRTYRLPTEAEWNVMVRECGITADLFDDSNANLNLAHYASSVPVDTFAHGKLFDAVGNVWQWTQTAIEGFEGFTPHPWYDDFSTPTFDTKHNLIKGGSWISTGNEIAAASRYAFRRHFIQHAGFRYVVGENADHQRQASVITDSAVVELCRFHYEEASALFQLAAEILAFYMPPGTSVLELGCGAGRLSLELSDRCERVNGIDFSARSIGVGTKLLEEGKIAYGEPVKQVDLEALQLPYAKERVEFYQGDIYNLKPHLYPYEMIVINNVRGTLMLDRINMEDVTNRLLPGGIIALIGLQNDRERIQEERLEYIRSHPVRENVISIWRKCVG